MILKKIILVKQLVDTKDEDASLEVVSSVCQRKKNSVFWDRINGWKQYIVQQLWVYFLVNY